MSTLTAKNALLLGGTSVPVTRTAVGLFNNNGGSGSASALTVSAPAGRSAGDLLVGVAHPASSLSPDPPTGYTSVALVTSARIAKRTATADGNDDFTIDPSSAEVMYGGLLAAITTALTTVTVGTSAGFQSVGSGSTSLNIAGSFGNLTAVGAGYQFLMGAFAYRGSSSATLSSLTTSDGTWAQIALGTFTTVQGKTGRYIFLGKPVTGAGALAAPSAITLTKSDTNPVEGTICRFAIS